MITPFYSNAARSSEGSTIGSEISPGLSRRRSSIITFSIERSSRRKKFELDFVVPLDNPMCHNTRKISLELEHNTIERAPHPAYSTDMSPYDLWLFGFLKEKFKEQELSTSDEIIKAITTI
jgi:hypothetical protein